MAMVTRFSLNGLGLILDDLEYDATEPHLALAHFNRLSIDEVDLRGNSFGTKACDGIQRLFFRIAHIKVLFLSDVFTSRKLEEIPKALSSICIGIMPHAHELLVLNMTGNALGTYVRPLADLLQFCCQLETLNLDNSGFSAYGGSHIADGLYENALRRKRDGYPMTLRVLTLGKNKMEDDSTFSWARAFAAHGSLMEVHLQGTGLRMEGITRLLVGLAVCHELRRLNLEDNIFCEGNSQAAVGALAVALCSWPQLEMLNIANSWLSPSEVPTIPEVVSVLATGSSPNLLELYIGNNDVQQHVFDLLANSILTGTLCVRRLVVEEEDVEAHNLTPLRLALQAKGGVIVVASTDAAVADRVLTDENEEDSVAELAAEVVEEAPVETVESGQVVDRIMPEEDVQVKEHSGGVLTVKRLRESGASDDSVVAKHRPPPKRAVTARPSLDVDPAAPELSDEGVSEEPGAGSELPDHLHFLAGSLAEHESSSLSTGHVLPAAKETPGQFLLLAHEGGFPPPLGAVSAFERADNNALSKGPMVTGVSASANCDRVLASSGTPAAPASTLMNDKENPLGSALPTKGHAAEHRGCDVQTVGGAPGRGALPVASRPRPATSPTKAHRSTPRRDSTLQDNGLVERAAPQTPRSRAGFRKKTVRGDRKTRGSDPVSPSD